MAFFKAEPLAELSAANFFARYHHYLVGLIISTFLAMFMSDIAVGWVLAGASTATALSLIFMPGVFNRRGTKRVLVTFGLVEMVIVMSLSLATSGAVAAILFALEGMCAYNMFLGLDILLEAQTTEEGKTGHARGLFLVLANLSVLAASLSLSFILHDHNYRDVFLIAAASLAPFTLLAMSLPSVSRVPGTHSSFHHTLREIFRRVSLFPTMAAHFLLLMFFAWEIYYLPLYLYEHIGFSWQVVALIFAASLIPYILMEYPIGMLADSRFGEKEFAFVGFLIMAGGIMLFSQAVDMAIVPWIALVLIANIGGAMVEVSTETHFFKRVGVTDTDLISTFRMLRPLSAIAAPLVASLSLLFVPFQFLFVVFGCVLLLGLPLVLSMTDTR